MNYQPHNEVSHEQGALPTMSRRLALVDGAVITASNSYDKTRVINGMETPIFKNIYDQFLAANALPPSAEPATVAIRRSRVVGLAPLNPMRFARRLVGAAFAVMPSGFTSNTVTQPVVESASVEPVTFAVSTEAVMASLQPIEVPTTTMTLQTIEVPTDAPLNVDIIRAQIAAMRENPSGASNAFN